MIMCILKNRPTWDSNGRAFLEQCQAITKIEQVRFSSNLYNYICKIKQIDFAIHVILVVFSRP